MAFGESGLVRGDYCIMAFGESGPVRGGLLYHGLWWEWPCKRETTVSWHLVRVALLEGYYYIMAFGESGPVRVRLLYNGLW